ncbi:MAG: hypothetical protein J6R04_08525 [Clostridia bacterium]|nr:hypothetical protein [Clostridia bacterium]
MADNRFPCAPSCSTGKETVCIETQRILDSCRDRDCYEDVRVFLTDFGNEMLERTNSIRVKHACIAYSSIHLDPVPFNRGFYTVHIRYYVKLDLEACIGGGRGQEIDGVAVLEKKVVLYGSESCVNIFKSNPDTSDYCAEPTPCGQSRNVPVAVVEVVDPIVLGVGVKEKDKCRCCCCCCDIPEQVSSHLGGSLTDHNADRYLTVSLGIFSVVRIVRPAQYLVEATEYCVPDKECIAHEEDDPCCMFRGMPFPVSEFCPPSLLSTTRGGQGDYADRAGRQSPLDRKHCGC